MNIGMQFYTLRDEMSQGYEAIFKRIAEVGYTGVEMTYSPQDGEIISELLKKYNLKGLGAHIGIDAVNNDIDTVTGFMEKLGSKNINNCLAVEFSLKFHDVIVETELIAYCR